MYQLHEVEYTARALRRDGRAASAAVVFATPPPPTKMRRRAAAAAAAFGAGAPSLRSPIRYTVFIIIIIIIIKRVLLKCR